MSKNFKQWTVKYRPKTIDDVIGNAEAKSQASQIIKKKDTHAILLHGPSGCSKTTLGRIIANGLTNHAHDIVDENVSDKRGINDVRDFIKASQYLPQGAFKVFILDEVHALMGQAQSAILKTIEEPVHDRVVWILCTDRPHQLDVPLLNRLYKIRVEKPTQGELAKLLYRVARKEDALDFEQDEVKKICMEVAKISDRVPREALQILKEISDKQENFKNYKDLVINGLRKMTEQNIDKIALQVIMCIYSPQRSIEDKIKHLFSILDDKDVWGLTLRLVDIHHHLLKYGAGVRGGPGYYFAKELQDTDSVPPLQLGIDIASKLVDIRNALHTINTGLHNYVIPKLAELVILANRAKKQKDG